jgi:ubiquinone/menaquinone biosynthesis C-methylase UbiE
VLARRPLTYLGVDRELSIISALDRRFQRESVRFVQGDAEDTGLPGETATVLFGEAMLSMPSETRRRRIIEEAWRVVRRSGRCGIHELCVCSTVSPAYRRKMEADLAIAIRHGVRLLSVNEWRELMESTGFRVTFKTTAPMRLLDPSRIIRDEGFTGALRFAWNTATHPAILRRVVEMRRTFHRYRDHLQAVAMVCVKEY